MSIAFYFLDPEEGVRRKYVLENPHPDEVDHYRWVAEQVAAGADFPAVGLYDVREVDLDTGELGEKVNVLAKPDALKTIRQEKAHTAPADEQGDLLDDAA